MPRAGRSPCRSLRAARRLQGNGLRGQPAQPSQRQGRIAYKGLDLQQALWLLCQPSSASEARLADAVASGRHARMDRPMPWRPAPPRGLLLDRRLRRPRILGLRVSAALCAPGSPLLQRHLSVLLSGRLAAHGRVDAHDEVGRVLGIRPVELLQQGSVAAFAVSGVGQQVELPALVGQQLLQQGRVVQLADAWRGVTVGHVNGVSMSRDVNLVRAGARLGVRGIVEDVVRLLRLTCKRLLHAVVWQAVTAETVTRYGTERAAHN
mmetsp:Transcript_36152/g.103998  ORF Transcript_36152/g.103998 Transcript_36152/m.103998 type:complete len:264 (-) Transcript_36152:193-984(-)